MKINEFPITPDVNQHKWAILQSIWSSYDCNSLAFTTEDDGWHIREFINNIQSFDLRRDFITLNRYTNQDTYGLLGLSLLDLTDSSVIITEGVSDFISVKLNNPNRNVLGVTTLGGNRISKTIIVSLFSNVLIVADADKTGLTTGYNWRKFLSQYNIKTKLWQPSELRFKDYTDEFLFNLRLKYGTK